MSDYAISESFGCERGVSHTFAEAHLQRPLHRHVGDWAAVALIPGLPLTTLMVLAQVTNGMLLPILFVIILRLVNGKRVMGSYVNSRTQNLIS